MISKACSNFLKYAGLSATQVRFGDAYAGPNINIIEFDGTRERYTAHIVMDDRELIWAHLVHYPEKERAFLTVCYPGLMYRETHDGYSKLSLQGFLLPESFCSANCGRGTPLSKIVEIPGDRGRFLREADPAILTLRNRKSLEIQMQDAWSRDNWDF